jgi:hypothetical protein
MGTGRSMVSGPASGRSLVASAAALPALAVPAVAEGHPDALLVELGRQFDRMVEMEEAIWRRYFANGVGDEYEQCAEALDAVGVAPFADRILAIRAQTIEGLKVKARIAYHLPHVLTGVSWAGPGV